MPVRWTKNEITADQWLEAFLRESPRTLAEVRVAAAEAGYAWWTISAAKAHILAHSPKPGIWALLPDDAEL